jgi:uncharacterized protein Veg
MRKAGADINDIKKQIQELSGKILNIRINPGRNKISTYNGIIDKIYPSVFTLKLQENDKDKFLSCSYSDVLCGKVQFLES